MTSDYSHLAGINPETHLAFGFASDSQTVDLRRITCVNTSGCKLPLYKDFKIHITLTRRGLAAIGNSLASLRTEANLDLRAQSPMHFSGMQNKTSQVRPWTGMVHILSIISSF